MSNSQLRRYVSQWQGILAAVDSARSGKHVVLYTPRPVGDLGHAMRMVSDCAIDCERVKGTWDLVFDSGGTLRVRDALWGLPEQSEETGVSHG